MGFLSRLWSKNWPSPPLLGPPTPISMPPGSREPPSLPSEWSLGQGSGSQTVGWAGSSVMPGGP